jgi:hypothetical protein
MVGIVVVIEQVVAELFVPFGNDGVVNGQYDWLSYRI